MKRFYYYEISGTKRAYEEGEESEQKRIGRSNEEIEKRVHEEFERAIREGYDYVKISIEKS